MRFVRPVFLLALLLAPSPLRGVWGQSAARTMRSEGYILGPGDVLRISVAGFPEFSQETLAVPPDGSASLARIGTIRLSGRTRAAVQEEVRQRLIARVRLRDPQVTVTLLTVRSGIIGDASLSGDVPRSGNFPLHENERLSSLLAEAGLNDRLDEKRATLSRAGASYALDLRGAAMHPGSKADVLLRAGDAIAVRTLAPAKIVVLGDVARPGVYELHRQPRPEAYELGLAPRLSDLLIRAGDLAFPGSGAGTSGGGAGTGGGGAGTGGGGAGTSGGGAGTGGGGTTGAVSGSAPASPGAPVSYAATLQRDGARLPLDVEAARDDVFGPANIFLHAGDTVSVRLVRPITVYLDGATAKTGSFELAPGAGVLQLLVLGGPLSRAPGELKASIRRGDTTMPFDLSALLLSSESSANVRLQNGDIVQLREPETVSVRVAGEVAKTGPLKVRPGATILDALLAAGGVSSSTPVQSARLSVLRQEGDGSQRVYEANAAGILGLTDVSTNMVLRDGDIINLARGEDQTVFVAGQVATPGTYPLGTGDSLAQLIVRAGGAKDDAALTRVRVSRRATDKTPATEVTIDAYDAVKTGAPLPFALKAGDTISVPLNTNQVLAMQAFAKPGYYAIPERGQLTLFDFLAKAQVAPGVRRLYISQADANGKIDPKTTPVRTIKLDDIPRGRQQNFALEPREVIYAESPKGPKTSPFQVLSTLGALSFLFP